MYQLDPVGRLTLTSQELSRRAAERHAHLEAFASARGRRATGAATPAAAGVAAPDGVSRVQVSGPRLAGRHQVLAAGEQRQAVADRHDERAAR